MFYFEVGSRSSTVLAVVANKTAVIILPGLVAQSVASDALQIPLEIFCLVVSSILQDV